MPICCLRPLCSQQLMRHSGASGAFTMTFRRKAVSSNTGAAAAAAVAGTSVLDALGRQAVASNGMSSSSSTHKRGSVLDLTSASKPARPKVLHPLQLASSPSSSCSSRVPLAGGGAATRPVLSSSDVGRSASPNISAAHASSSRAVLSVSDCDVVDVEQQTSTRKTASSGSTKKKSPSKGKPKASSSAASVGSACPRT